ncbi:hypothetical protein [Streptomyces sp. NBC_00370]|uniref:hypothetical protein n=1 Tax=Streptomyces sp. NBC_00370 TaxID=2975728 RepID=UPI002E2670FE
MSQTASPASAPRRRRRPLRIAAAFLVLLGVAAYVITQYVTGGPHSQQCKVVAKNPGDDKASYELSPEQAANAATISAVGTTRGMPERAVTIALATSLQESALRNLDHGDRDSLGLFQQRPSKGWGTAAQIVDPVYSSGQFYDHLAKIPGYSRLPLTVAAQRVQRSGFPQAYAKHEPDATLLAAAFTGRAAAVLTCPAPAPAVAGDPKKVRAALVSNFGRKVLPQPDPSQAPASEEVGGPAGPEVSVPVDALPPAEGGRRGWELAQWAVAQAAELHISEVGYAGRVWSAAKADQGWRRADDGSSKAKAKAEEASNDVRIRIAQ